MTDVTIRELAASIDDFVAKRDWKKYHRPKDIAIALSVEASELLELFLWKDARNDLSDDELEKVKMEVADVVIYAISLANACRFDLGDAVLEKIAVNETKYPIENSRDRFG